MDGTQRLVNVLKKIGTMQQDILSNDPRKAYAQGMLDTMFSDGDLSEPQWARFRDIVESFPFDEETGGDDESEN